MLVCSNFYSSLPLCVSAAGMFIKTMSRRAPRRGVYLKVLISMSLALFPVPAHSWLLSARCSSPRPRWLWAVKEKSRASSVFFFDNVIKQKTSLAYSLSINSQNTLLSYIDDVYTQYKINMTNQLLGMQEIFSWVFGPRTNVQIFTSDPSLDLGSFCPCLFPRAHIIMLKVFVIIF